MPSEGQTSGRRLPMPAGGDLDALMAAEQRLAKQLEETKDRACRLVQQARDEADEAERRLETDLGEAAAGLEGRLLSERSQAIAEMERAFKAEAERFRDVGQDQIEAWAESVLAVLVEGEPQ